MFGGFLRGFEQLFSDIPNLIIIIFSVVFVSFFDATGTIISLANLCGFSDENENIEGFDKALIGNAFGGIISAICGTSTTSSYIESATGIETGGKTGLTAIVVGICFLISIFFSPIILALFTTPVTAYALVLVGILMVNQLENVRLSDPVIGTSIFMTISMTLLTSSISFGIAWGFSLFSILEIIAGKFKELNTSVLILSLISYYIYSLDFRCICEK